MLKGAGGPSEGDIVEGSVHQKDQRDMEGEYVEIIERNEDTPNYVMDEMETGILEVEEVNPVSCMVTSPDNSSEREMTDSEKDVELSKTEDVENDKRDKGRNGKENLLIARLIMEMFHTSCRDTATIGIKNLKKLKNARDLSNSKKKHVVRELKNIGIKLFKTFSSNDSRTLLFFKSLLKLGFQWNNRKRKIGFWSYSKRSLWRNALFGL